MAKKLALAAVLLILCVSLPNSLALGGLVYVTKETQKELQLDFTLQAEKVDAEAVIVRMEVRKTGKLAKLRHISLDIGSGRPMVHAILQTSKGKDASESVTFQVSPELAQKTYIGLNVPSATRSYTIYSVELKGYIVNKQ